MLLYLNQHEKGAINDYQSGLAIKKILLFWLSFYLHASFIFIFLSLQKLLPTKMTSQ